MMGFSFTHQGALVIVLDEENIERVQANDPFEFTTAKSPIPLALSLPLRIMIAYCRKEDMPKVQAMMEFPGTLMAYLSRGYRITDTDKQRGDKQYNELRPPKVREI